MEKTKQVNFWRALGESLIVFLILAAICAVSVFFNPLLLLLPVPLIYITVYRGFFYGFIPLMLTAAGLCMLGGYILAALFLAFFTPVVYIISYVTLKKLRSFEAVVFSVGSFVLGMALVAAFIYLVLKTNLIAYILNIFEGFLRAEAGLPQKLLFVMNLPDIMSGIKSAPAVLKVPDAEAISTLVSSVRNVLVVEVPALLTVSALVAGLSDYVIARRLLKKKNVDVAPMPKLSEFRLPKGFFASLFAVAGILTVAYLLNMKNFNAIFNAFYYAYAVVFVVCGMSFLDYFLIKKNIGSKGRVAIITVTTLLLWFLVVWVGLFDAVFKIKDRMERPDDFDGE